MKLHLLLQLPVMVIGACACGLGYLFEFLAEICTRVETWAYRLLTPRP